MPEVIAVTVYRIEELPEPAREQVRAWYRQHCLDRDWYDAVFADFVAVCGILGVTLRPTPVQLMGGGSRPRRHIFFRGFWCQGTVRASRPAMPMRGGPGSIRRRAPLDVELHRIVDHLQAVQRHSAEARHRGHYCHEGCMAITVERDGRFGQAMTAGTGDIVAAALRDLARWLYRQLEREYEHLASDAVVDKALAASDLSFTEDGRRFG